MIPFEPERYELLAGPAYTFDLNRRELFKLLGGGVIVVSIVSDASAQESGGGRRRGSGPAAPKEIGAWLHIGEDGAVTVYTGKVEIGQNARTSLTQVVCEELRLPMSSVKLVMGDTDLTPYDAGTFGSQTTPQMVPRLRKAAAAAREMLIDLGSPKLECGSPNSCSIGWPHHAARYQPVGRIPGAYQRAEAHEGDRKTLPPCLRKHGGSLASLRRRWTAGPW